jgi:hypothetical protein
MMMPSNYEHAIPTLYTSSQHFILSTHENNCRPTWLPVTREQAVCHAAPLHAALSVGDGSGAAMRLEKPWLGGIHPDETT